MKVVCIKTATNTVQSGRNDTANVVVGNEYTVIDIIRYKGEDYYSLEEIDGAVFYEGLFAPLSDLDETTLVNEEFNEKYCVPVNHNI